MMDFMAANGTKIGTLSDDGGNEETLIINGKSYTLSQVYADKELKDAFNAQIRSIKENLNVQSD